MTSPGYPVCIWASGVCARVGVRVHRLVSPISCVPSMCPEDRAALWGHSGADLGGPCSSLERAYDSLMSPEPPGGTLWLSPELGDPPLSAVPPTEGQSPADPALEVDGAPCSLPGRTARAGHGAGRPPTQASGGHSREGVLCQVGWPLLLALLLGERATGEPPTPGRWGCAQAPLPKALAGTPGQGHCWQSGRGRLPVRAVLPGTQARGAVSGTRGAVARLPPMTSAPAQAAGAVPHGDVSQLPKKERHG